MRGEIRATASYNVKKTKVELDYDAILGLNEIREELKRSGISGVTYSDVVRWLLVKANKREGQM